MSVKVYKNGSLQTIAGVAVEPLTGTRDEIETYANSGQLIDGQIAYITDDYTPADAVVTDDVLKTKEAVSAVTSYGKVADAMVIKELQSNFQAGVDGIYDAIVAKGTTPASKSLSDIISGINNIKSGYEYTTITTPAQASASSTTTYTNIVTFPYDGYVQGSIVVTNTSGSKQVYRINMKLNDTQVCETGGIGNQSSYTWTMAFRHVNKGDVLKGFCQCANNSGTPLFSPSLNYFYS